MSHHVAKYTVSPSLQTPDAREPVGGFTSDDRHPDLLIRKFLDVLDGRGEPDDFLWLRDVSKFRAGCLADGVAFWKDVILPDSGLDIADRDQILSWLSLGVHVPDFFRPFSGSFNGTAYVDVQQPPPYRQRNHRLPPDHFAFVSTEIASLVADGSLRPATKPPSLVLPLFVVERNDKKRLIYDARYPNCFSPSPPVRYDTLRDFQRGLHEGDFLFSVDHKSGYHQVPVSAASSDYLGLRWQGKDYVWTTIPFGWSPACFIYQRLSSVAMSFLRKRGWHILVYLDDIATKVDAAASPRDRYRAVWLFFAFFYLAGYVISLPKANIPANPRMEILGFGLDTVSQSFFVPKKKLAAITDVLKDMLRRESVSLPALQSIVGKCQSLSLAVPCISVHLMSSYAAISRAGRRSAMLIELTAEMKEDFACLLELDSWSLFAKWHPEFHTQLRLETDAAGGASGGWGACLWTASGAYTVSGRFDDPSDTDNINERETEAVLRSTRRLEPVIRDCSLDMFVDNETVRFGSIKGSSSLLYLRNAARELLRFQLRNNVLIRIHRVTTVDNAVADSLSRTGHSAPVVYSEIKLSRRLFDAVCRLVDRPFTIDACAAHDNHHLPRYICGPASLDSAAVAQNAFLFLFGDHEFVYCFPPWALISALWRHFRLTRSAGVMIAPNDATRQWFGMLHAEARSVTTIAAKRDADALQRKRDNVWVDMTLTFDLLAFVFDFRTVH